jgi:chromosome segregation ATPase
MLAIEELEMKKRALESGIQAEREKSAELAEENKKLVNTQEYLRSDLVHWRSEVQKLTLERDSMQGGGNEHKGRLAEVENIIVDALATVDALLVNKSPAAEE